jgi:hypothetical protein
MRPSLKRWVAPCHQHAGKTSAEERSGMPITKSSRRNLAGIEAQSGYSR